MIELAFAESPAGALKLAKSMKQGDRLHDGSFGSSTDVMALSLALDIGDISDMNTGMKARRKQLDDLFAVFPGVPEVIWETSRQAVTRLEDAKATLEPVRMWICAGNPSELCGFYFVCHMLADVRTPLSVVRIPEQIEKDNTLISYHHTGEIIPEALSGFTEYEQPVSELERSVYANTWSGLVRENAPLRAVINGSLMGVPEDFYDFALRTYMPDGEFKVARLIGKTLGYIPGVGDRWLFLRIQAMLGSGELIEVAPPTGDHPYSGVVKLKRGDS